MRKIAKGLTGVVTSLVAGVSLLASGCSDYFYRPDKEKDLNYIVDEIIDAEFMLDQIKLITWIMEPETFNILRKLRNDKYHKLEKLLRNNMI